MSHRRSPPGWRTWLIVWLIGFGLWICYVGKFSWEESAAGVVAALVATVAVMVYGRLGLVRFRPRLRDLAEAWRLPWYMIVGTGEIMAALMLQLFARRGAPSALQAVVFRPGGHDTGSVARRALAVTYTTVTPNFIVLGILGAKRLLVYHQILPGEVLQITIDLGAEP